MTTTLPRVLHVIGPLNVGGAQTQLLGLIRAAHSTRWTAALCATSAGTMLDEFEATGIDVVQLDRSRGPASRVRQLRSLVRTGSFDVLHANLWHPNAYARMSVIGRTSRPAVVISERNVEAGRALPQRATDRVLARWTDAYVGNSEAVCDFIAEVHPVARPEVVHIANAVDKDVFHPASLESTDHDGLRVGAIGRLFPEKGFDILIEAARLLVRGPNPLPLTVEIAGAGPLRPALEAEAQGLPVRFVGELGRGEPVARFLRELAVFVLPSTHREGRANVLLEALSCGVPTVATDIAGTDEAVGGGATLARPGDPVSLADAIRVTAADQSARTRALAHAATIPGFDALADSYVAVFERAMDARRDTAR